MLFHRNLSRATVDELVAELARRGVQTKPPLKPGQVEVPTAQLWGAVRELGQLAGVVLPDAVRELGAARRELVAVTAVARDLEQRLEIADGAVAVLVTAGWQENLDDLLEDAS
jgi:hypothetical protein